MSIPSTLEELEAEFLDRPSLDILGDAIRYRPAGSAWTDMRAFVDYGDAVSDADTGKVIAQDIAVELLKADVPAKPNGQCRLTLAKTGAAEFRPINVMDAGSWWKFGVERA